MIRKRSLFSLCMVLILGICTLSFGGCGNSQTADDQNVSATSANDDMTSSAEEQDAAANAVSSEDYMGPDSEGLMSGLHHVTMEIKDYGTVSIELNADKAPVSVTNFIDLANEGFYDGLTFHRAMPYIIQGGAPLSGSVTKIYGEFADNGSDNDLSNTQGAIAMARRGDDYNSAGSQFFFDLIDMSSYYDGEYAVFGYVTDGMDVLVDMYNNSVTHVVDSNYTVDEAYRPVISKVTVID